MSPEQNNKPTRIVKCPHCKTPVEWGPQSPYRPFCSERCKLIDTGAWAEGAYRIISQDDPDTDIPDDEQSI